MRVYFKMITPTSFILLRLGEKPWNGYKRETDDIDGVTMLWPKVRPLRKPRTPRQNKASKDN